LLQQVNMPIQVVAPLTLEKQKKGEKPKALVRRLAIEKAESIIDLVLVHPGQRTRSIIIAADTIVVDPVNGKVLGKPKDRAHARKMLRTLSGRAHSVLTGYCIISLEHKLSTLCKRQNQNRVVESRVKMRSLDESTIREYVQSGEPLDKAGSYAAQGIGCAFIESIQGSFTNVIGLPVMQILEDLEKEFGISLFSWS